MNGVFKDTTSFKSYSIVSDALCDSSASLDDFMKLNYLLEQQLRSSHQTEKEAVSEAIEINQSLYCITDI